MSQRSRITPKRSAHPSRHGATILVVLVLISMTLAFSYAMMRTQTVSSQVQRNYERRADAKHAALAGISIGMRKMSDASWAGVGVDLTGNLSNELSYTVTFETGDSSLTPGHPEMDEYPYRVTVTSTGISTAPSDPSQQSSHTIRAVMQLIRRRLQPTPTAWEQVQPYTLYQWNANNGRVAEIEMPNRLEGPVAFQNEIELCEEYPSNGHGEAFDGAIDGVAIFGSALSSEVIEDLYQGNVTRSAVLGEPSNLPVASWQFEDASSSLVAEDELGLHPGIYDGARADAVSDDGSGAASFDGLNDQVFLGPVGVFTGKLTILARVKIDAFNDAMQIVSSSTTSNTYWALSVDGSERRLRFSVRSYFGSDRELTSANDLLSADEWIDVAAVYDGNQLELYLDGVRVGQTYMLGYLGYNTAADVSIGSRSPGSGRARYLRDLRLQHEAGGPDYRPFDGPISLHTSVVSTTTQSLAEHDLGVPIEELILPSGPPVANPGAVSQYQLYPGGQFYPVTQLSGWISNMQYGPNPQTNPLGLFVCADVLHLYDNVTISGTVLTHRASTAGDIHIAGDNVTLQAVNLPPLWGETEPRQLPVAIVNNDFEIENNSSGSLNGLAVTWDDFRFRSGDVATDFKVTGKLIVSELQLRRRTQWDQGTSWWNSRMSEFMRSIDWQSPTTSKFPEWLATNHGLDSAPRFHARPAITTTHYHWHDWSQPLFAAHPNDQGLRWDLIEWRDNPE